MTNTSYFNKDLEERYPHADDVSERMTAENSFAAGWGMHHKPVPKYIFDNHIHYNGSKTASLKQCIKPFADEWESHNVTRAMILVNMYGINRDHEVPGYAKIGSFPWFTVDEITELYGDIKTNEKYFLSAWVDHREPDPDLIRALAGAGFKGIKLHNAPIIETNAPYDLWLSDEWRKTFNAVDECKLPVLIHVTQRLPCAEYVGGKRNAYWTTGWENGVTYGNEDLLQTFLKCCELYPNIKFIGAHQLHIGWERLDKLFSEYPNLYVDLTIGCTLRLYDDFYPHDKEYLRNIFIKHADRLVFGTDNFWGTRAIKPDNTTLEQHLRFISLLDLPAETLNKVCHGNTELIYGLEPLVT